MVLVEYCVPRRAGSVGITVVLRAGIPRIKDSSRLVLYVTCMLWGTLNGAPHANSGKCGVLARVLQTAMPGNSTSCLGFGAVQCHNAVIPFPQHCQPIAMRNRVMNAMRPRICVSRHRGPPLPNRGWPEKMDTLTTVTGPGASPSGDAAWVFLAEPPGL